MTQRTKHALEAGTVFAVVLLLVFITGLGTISETISDQSLWVGGAWHFGVAFWVAFFIWWLVFRSAKVGIWHAIYAGYVIVVLCQLATPLLLSAVFGLEWLVTLMKAIPLHLLESVPVSVPFMLLAMAVRWWQLRSAAREHQAS